jgi:quinoprotein relay system zinc metallohydrolase 2
VNKLESQIGILAMRFVILTVALSCASTIVRASSGTDFALSEIADGVFVHEGRLADLDDPARGDSANIGFIIGETCVAVIDTGGSIATGRALAAAIGRTTPLPVCFVINTHVHFDHVLGNAAFAGGDTVFVGHENLRAAIEANREFFIEQFAAELGGVDAGLIIAPTKGVAAESRLDLGGRELQLAAHPLAHTSTDLTVFDTKTATLWTGDLVFIGRMPVLDGSLRGWLAWIEQTQNLAIARIVPGHGPASAAWPDGVAAEQQYLSALLRDARAAIAAGVFLEDAMDSMSRDAAAPWPLNARHPRNVSRAYRELEWE